MSFFTWTNVATALAVVVGAFVVVIAAMKRQAEKSGSWLPGLPAPPAEFKRHFMLGHLKYFATAAPPRGGLPDILGGMSLVLGGDQAREGLTAFYFMRGKAISAIKGEHVRKLLGSTTFRRGVPMRMKHMDRVLGTESLTLVDHSRGTPVWKSHRKLVTRGFYSESLKQMVPAIDKVALQLIGSLKKRVDPLGPAGFEVDVMETMKMGTLDVIGHLAFGTDFGCSDNYNFSKLAESFQVLLEDLTYRTAGRNIFKPNLAFYSWPSERNRRNSDARNLLRGTLRDLISSRRKELASADASSTRRLDALSMMLMARDGNPQESAAAAEGKPRAAVRQEKVDGMSEDALVDNLVTLLFAGFDTTSIALSFAIWLLWKNPEIHEKVRNEARRVLGDARSSLDDEARPLANNGDVQQLAYTAATFKEVLRLYPSAPVTFRETVSPVDLGDGLPVIPSGTKVYLPLILTHRSDMNFTEPMLFDPERFLVPRGSSTQINVEGAREVDEATIERRKKEMRWWMPFSAGRRDCIGQRFAMLEGTLLLARLVLAFDFDFPEGYDPDPIMTGPIITPSTPLRAHARAV